MKVLKIFLKYVCIYKNIIKYAYKYTELHEWFGTIIQSPIMLILMIGQFLEKSLNLTY